ncbi:phosphotransferase [Ekhidna sp.]|uniref:phosphotransferase n=1 Tax=Ekhidna sp. TaxID=2608089 RepID=UPI003CCB9BC5
MKSLEVTICKTIDAESIEKSMSVQSLWGGYGEIRRYFLNGGRESSVIVKHIQLSNKANHPKGWNTSRSHKRKLKSYEVESKWYQSYTNRTNENCRTPRCHFVRQNDDELLFIMEDLNASGFPVRLTPETVTIPDIKNCLSWLAHFHACFIHCDAKGLWEKGTYWHLETRPDEWGRMENNDLKQAAAAIDTRLNNANFQTLVHGDAKLANFCFGEKEKVAAVDFQYVGKGVGIKDVAYFISSCLDEQLCEKYESELLEHYFNSLEKALDHSIGFKELKKEWGELYKYAWADFYRFLDGWSPGHWKMHGYSKQMVQNVINELVV